MTGCVATAMAQIVNYHKLPAGNGTGSASVTYNGTTYTFDYANESFDWDNMLDIYNGSYTSEQANAVAKLMYACGVGVDIVLRNRRERCRYVGCGRRACQPLRVRQGRTRVHPQLLHAQRLERSGL